MMRVFTGVGRPASREMPSVLMPAWRKSVCTSSPAPSRPSRPTGRTMAPRACTLWAALAAPPLAVGEAQDEDGSFARDARRLAEEVLVGDEVADHRDALAGKARERVLEPPHREHVSAPRPRRGRAPSPPRRADPGPRGPA